MSSSPPPCSNSKTAAAGHAPTAAGRYCLCAPTTHPGSFRCRLHRSSSSSMDATAVVVAPPSLSEEAKEAAAATAARVFLERMTMARKPRRQGVSGTMFLPRPSRLGAATATDDE